MLSRILLEENSMYEANKPIIQTAYAVNNVIEAAERWSKRFNIGPFFFNEHIEVSDSRVNGINKNFDHSSAYGWKENLMIELICDHSHITNKANNSGTHHIAWIAKDFEKESKELLKQDCKEVLFARAGDRNGMKFSWFDPGHDIGHLYEIYEDNESLKNFYSYVYKAYLEWDGKNTLRNITEII